jgi:hypothetical protein
MMSTHLERVPSLLLALHDTDTFVCASTHLERVPSLLLALHDTDTFVCAHRPPHVSV